MSWYDLDSKKTETPLEYVRKLKYENIIIKRTKNFTDIIGDEIEDKIQYRMVTERAFNAIIVLEFLLKKYQIDEIYIAVYRMNLLSVNKIKEIIDYGNIKCSILLSSFFRENKKYEKWCEELMMYSKTKDHVNISFAVNHAKVFLAKTKCNKFIVFEGSGNLSDNARIEQYLLENNEITYNFHKTWINETIEKYKWK